MKGSLSQHVGRLLSMSLITILAHHFDWRLSYLVYVYAVCSVEHFVSYSMSLQLPFIPAWQVTLDFDCEGYNYLHRLTLQKAIWVYVKSHRVSELFSTCLFLSHILFA